jgi:hypothetical protein
MKIRGSIYWKIHLHRRVAESAEKRRCRNHRLRGFSQIEIQLFLICEILRSGLLTFNMFFFENIFCTTPIKILFT